MANKNIHTRSRFKGEETKESGWEELNRTLRSTAGVILVLGGWIFLELQDGCGRPESRRPIYNSRADCVNDWGTEQCEEAPPDSTNHGVARYFGPYSADPSQSRRAVDFTDVRRGGFGSTGSRFSSGG